jgi:hypothetical protein
MSHLQAGFVTVALVVIAAVILTRFVLGARR